MYQPNLYWDSEHWRFPRSLAGNLEYFNAPVWVIWTRDSAQQARSQGYAERWPESIPSKQDFSDANLRREICAGAMPTQLHTTQEDAIQDFEDQEEIVVLPGAVALPENAPVWEPPNPDDPAHENWMAFLNRKDLEIADKVLNEPYDKKEERLRRMDAIRDQGNYILPRRRPRPQVFVWMDIDGKL